MHHQAAARTDLAHTTADLPTEASRVWRLREYAGGRRVNSRRPTHTKPQVTAGRHAAAAMERAERVPVCATAPPCPATRRRPRQSNTRPGRAVASASARRKIRGEPRCAARTGVGRLLRARAPDHHHPVLRRIERPTVCRNAVGHRRSRAARASEGDTGLGCADEAGAYTPAGHSCRTHRLSIRLPTVGRVGVCAWIGPPHWQ
jgi:hypothetical protein